MPYYKDQNDKPYFLDSAEFKHLIPTECIEITEAEAYILSNPPPTPEQVKATRMAEIKAALAEIDAKSIRPLRDGDTARLANLEAQAQALRQELAAL